MKPTVQAVDAILPQTQCGLCTYAGCQPYAQAIVENNEAINLCPPGGQETLLKLATLTGQNVQTMLTDMADKEKGLTAAVIREDECIGCTKCIQACPVDAILGTGKQMHSVIASECTGCELCVEPCPVDCIDIIDLPQRAYQPDTARQRFQARNQRLAQLQAEKSQRFQKAKLNNKTANTPTKKASINATLSARQRYIQDAVQRVKQKRQHR